MTPHSQVLVGLGNVGCPAVRAPEIHAVGDPRYMIRESTDSLRRRRAERDRRGGVANALNEMTEPKVVALDGVQVPGLGP